MIDSIAHWIGRSAWAHAIDTSSWVWAACETLHFIGMALLIGTVGLLDLRMMGFIRGLPLRPLRRLLPWGVFGFAINVVTGIVFFIGEPLQCVHNIAFQLKLLFILVGGVNVLVFYRTGLS